MNESAKKFSSEEVNFYDSQVSSLTSIELELGLTKKMIFEGNELHCRLESRRDKLRDNLEKYGLEIFSGNARPSLPSSFMLEIRNQILKNGKQKGMKVEELNAELCPERLSGLLKIAANVKGKPRGFAGYPTNMNIFLQAKDGGYLDPQQEYVCTKFDIYNFDFDDIVDQANELLTIRITLSKWKRKKWPKLIIEDLLKEPESDKWYEIQQRFERAYFLILEGGRDIELPSKKSIYQRDSDCPT